MPSVVDICTQDISRILKDNVREIGNHMKLSGAFNTCNPTTQVKRRQKLVDDVDIEVQTFINYLQLELNNIAATEPKLAVDVKLLGEEQIKQASRLCFVKIVKLIQQYDNSYENHISKTHFKSSARKIFVATHIILTAAVTAFDNMRHFYYNQEGKKLESKAIIIMYTSVNSVYQAVGKILYKIETGKNAEKLLRSSLKTIDSANDITQTNQCINLYSAADQIELRKLIDQIYNNSLQEFINEVKKLPEIINNKRFLAIIDPSLFEQIEHNILPSASMTDFMNLHNDFPLVPTFRGISLLNSVKMPPDRQSQIVSTTTNIGCSDNFIQSTAGPNKVPFTVVSYNNLYSLKKGIGVREELSAYSEDEHIVFPEQKNIITLYMQVKTQNNSYYFTIGDIYNKSPNFCNFKHAYKHDLPLNGSKILHVYQGIITYETAATEFGIAKESNESSKDYCKRFANTRNMEDEIESKTNTRSINDYGCNIL